MRQNLISADAIVAKIHRDFKPSNKGWEADVYEWIGEAIGLLKISNTYISTVSTIKVKNYRAKIPCNTENLFGITRNGYKLERSNEITLPKNIDALLLNAPSRGESYDVNANFIHFSFKEGEVKVFYNTFPLDENNLPLIPKDFNVIDAITWYCIKQLILGGLKHNVVNYQMADYNWEEKALRASNSIKQLSYDQRASLSKNMLTIIPNVEK